MKNIFFLFLLQVFCLPLFSQSIGNLDTKYGFNKFKFGSSTSLYKKDLVLIYNVNPQDNLKFYKYTGKDIRKVFEIFVDKIELGYYKDRLYHIGITFNTQNQYYKYQIYDKIKNLFGAGIYTTDYKIGSTKYSWGYHWKSKKVYLSFDQEKSGETSLWLTSNIIEQQMNNDDF